MKIILKEAPINIFAKESYLKDASIRIDPKARISGRKRLNGIRDRFCFT